MIPIGVNAENVIDFIAKMGRPMDLSRVYMQTQDWNTGDARIKEALAAHARGERVIVTMKVNSVPNAINGSDDARQARILNGFKQAGLSDLIWGVFHEPEDDVEKGAFTDDQWRAMQAHMLPLANTILHPTGGKTISILMSWTANPSSGRNPADFRVPEADIQGWDIYEKAGQSVSSGVVWATKDPSTMPLDALWGRCLDLSAAWGKPTLVPEFGVLRRQADTLGVEREAYFQKLADWPRIAEVGGVVYYEVGPPRFNYAFRTEAAGCTGFKAIGAAGGVVTPPGDCDECEAALAAEHAQVVQLTSANTQLLADLNASKVALATVTAELNTTRPKADKYDAITDIVNS